MNKKDRIHDWRKLKWPFTATFLYYSLLSLFTGMAEQSEEGFLAMFAIVLIVDAVAYLCYCFFLCSSMTMMTYNIAQFREYLQNSLHALTCYMFYAHQSRRYLRWHSLYPDLI